MIAVDVLAGNDEWKSSAEAIKTMVKQGYLQRKTFAKINEVVDQAHALRMKKTEH